MAVAFVFPGHQCFYKYVCRAEQEKEEDSTQEFFNFPASHCHQAKFGGTKMYTKVRGQNILFHKTMGIIFLPSWIYSVILWKYPTFQNSSGQLQTLGAIR